MVFVAKPEQTVQTTARIVVGKRAAVRVHFITFLGIINLAAGSIHTLIFGI